MQAGDIPRALIVEMLGADRQTRRFEQFTADHFSLRDNIHYETTAPTGDDGVDAEGRVELEKGLGRVCATTQKKGCRAKGIEDIDKVAKLGMATARLHLCFSSDVEARVLNDVRAYGQSKFPEAIVEAHGLSGLSDLAFRRQQAFIDNYARDLDVHTLSYSSRFDADEDTNQVDLLRLAVTTVFHPDIVKQQQALMENLLLIALADGKAHPPGDITSRVSRGLKLTSAPDSSYVVAGIESLRQRDLIKKTTNGCILSAAGSARRDELVIDGTRNSLTGRGTFEAMLGQAVEAMTTGQLTTLWRVVQNSLASLFTDNGLKVVAEIREMAQQGQVAEAGQTRAAVVQGAIADLLSKIDALNIGPQVKVQVAVVLAAMFKDRSSAAFGWIRKLAVKYIVICGLGLDPQIDVLLRERIKKWVVVPDTHVVLSYLCEGDAGHDACKSVLSQVKRLDGTIWAMEAVLEEAVNHADIADRSFRDWQKKVASAQAEFDNVRPVDLVEEDDNAFVKGFAVKAGLLILQRDWQLYIAQYRSNTKLDDSKIGRILNDELHAEIKLDDHDIRGAGTAYAAKLSRRKTYIDSQQATARRQWDGRLLASCLVRAQSEAKDKRVLIVSESDQIKNAFRDDVAKDKRRNVRVVDTVSIACTLAVVPGTSVNLECCRSLPFDFVTELPADLQAENLLAETFSSATRLRFLRPLGLRAALESAALQLTADD